jgi:hypothetical protein
MGTKLRKTGTGAAAVGGSAGRKSVRAANRLSRQARHNEGDIRMELALVGRSANPVQEPETNERVDLLIVYPLV